MDDSARAPATIVARAPSSISLTGTAAEWDAFTAGVRDGEFDF